EQEPSDKKVKLEDSVKKEELSVDEKYLQSFHYLYQPTIMSIAYALDVKGLHKLLARAIAKSFDGKTAEEIRAMWHIVDDRTPEQKQKCKEMEELLAKESKTEPTQPAEPKTIKTESTTEEPAAE